jgi:hypothetical protein
MKIITFNPNRFLFKYSCVSIATLSFQHQAQVNSEKISEIYTLRAKTTAQEIGNIECFFSIFVNRDQ